MGIIDENAVIQNTSENTEETAEVIANPVVENDEAEATAMPESAE